MGEGGSSSLLEPYSQYLKVTLSVSSGSSVPSEATVKWVLDIIKYIVLIVNTNWGGSLASNDRYPNVRLSYLRRPSRVMSELQFCLSGIFGADFFQKWYFERKSTLPAAEIPEVILLSAHPAFRLFGYSFDFCELFQYPSGKVSFSLNLAVSFCDCNQKNLNYYNSYPQIITVFSYWASGIHQVLKYIIVNSKNNPICQVDHHCSNKRIEVLSNLLKTIKVVSSRDRIWTSF